MHRTPLVDFFTFHLNRLPEICKKCTRIFATHSARACHAYMHVVHVFTRICTATECIIYIVRTYRTHTYVSRNLAVYMNFLARKRCDEIVQGRKAIAVKINAVVQQARKSSKGCIPNILLTEA